MAITREMVEQAYSYGKRVYSGEIGWNQAKVEINEASGMGTG